MLPNTDQAEAVHFSDLANTSLGLDSRSISSSNSGSVVLEQAKDRSVRALKRGTAAVSVRSASVLDSSLALAVGAAGGRSKHASLVLQHGGLHVLEDVALGQDLSTRGSVVESVAGVVLPEVVDRVEHGVSADLGGSAAGVVDVVALQGNLVVRAGRVQSPVVVTVAGRGVFGVAVKVVVRNGDAVRCILAKDDHLAADVGELAVICDISVSTFKHCRGFVANLPIQT